MTDIEYDSEYVWHPYAALGDGAAKRLVKSASGLELELDDGRKLIDAVSSWWCVAHGHNHPHIVEAMRRQSEKLCHVMFGGLTHGPAIELARRLKGILPAGIDKVFFADSGSISVEVAAKMAIQYQTALGRPGRNRIVALKGAYHGDTSLAMALSDPDGMHVLFKGIMTKHFFADKPACPFGGEWVEGAAASLEKILAEHEGEIAAVICEPVFQAANAMNFYHPRYLGEMRRLCDEHGAVLIFDEIAAGFYRTGPLWAQDHAQVTPDIMCIGKALTGGHVTMAATVASEKVADAISSGDPPAFMHGPTYMANPLACSAAIASLELFEGGGYAERVKRIEGELKEGLAPLKGAPNVKDVRVLGAAGVVEVERLPSREDISRVIDECGVWLRPFSNYIYAMPPLVSGSADISRITAAMREMAHCPPGPEDLSGFHE